MVRVSLSTDRGQLESLQVGDYPLTNSVSEPSLHITLPTPTTANEPSVDDLMKEIETLKARHQLEIQSLETKLNLVNKGML